MIKNGYFKRAFTLTEVLIALGVIGVIAAMTLPTLTQNYQKQAYVSQLHKIYNEFQQGFVRLQDDANAVNLVEAKLRNGREEDFLKSRFKVVKDCGTGTGCFAPEYRSINSDNGTASIDADKSYYKITIANGASIGLYLREDVTTADVGTEAIGSVYVDTNGLKGPNQGGRDYFRMYIYADGVLDDYLVTPNCRRLGGTTNCVRAETAQGLREENFTDWCLDASDTDGCFGRLLNTNWQMNY